MYIYIDLILYDFTVTIWKYISIEDTFLLKIFDENYKPNQYLTVQKLYMHTTGVNYGIDGKKITDKICTSIIYVK